MIGGGLGAYVLTATPRNLIRPIVGIYLGLMGAVVLWKAFQREERREPRRVRLIGFVGGFLDAVGGGGWGALVASSLVGQGAQARLAIGSTNAAEFLVTVTISATFVMTIRLELWPIIVGLIVGGVVAAPFAAYVTRRLPVRVLMPFLMKRPTGYGDIENLDHYYQDCVIAHELPYRRIFSGRQRLKSTSGSATSSER